MRYLGVDLGEKRIGLALADSETGVVSPLRVINARPGLLENVQAILAVVDEYAVEAIVLGLPLNMDDTEGPQARFSRMAAEALGRASSLPVHLHDERLTSHAADQRMTERDLSRRRKQARQDAVAAQILLESFMQQQETGRAQADEHPPQDWLLE